ncbi:hypothetical protein ACHAW6_003156 [Cyclotella cf. meneghiniana]
MNHTFFIWRNVRPICRRNCDVKLGNSFRWLSAVTPMSDPTSSPASTRIISPTTDQLRIVALRAAIPMIGFGFMDNLVMMTAGEAIDSTFGVTLGISTLMAAGFGQCFSDVAGNLSGGLVDGLVSKLHLPRHGLTQEQLESRLSRLYSTLGACVGVVTGCLLGMSCLLFMDTDRADRARKAKELQSIFESVMGEGKKLFHAERAALFMLDEEKGELWSQVATGTKGIIKVNSNEGIVGACVQSGKLINVPDAYKDDRFDVEVDTKTGFRTKSVLAMPVTNDEGKIIGALQMLNKKNEDGSDGVFNSCEEQLARLMASHVKSFIRIVEG